MLENALLIVISILRNCYLVLVFNAILLNYCRFSNMRDHWLISHFWGLYSLLLSMLQQWPKLLLELLLIMCSLGGSLMLMEYSIIVNINRSRTNFFSFCFHFRPGWSVGAYSLWKLPGFTINCWIGYLYSCLVFDRIGSNNVWRLILPSILFN